MAIANLHNFTTGVCTLPDPGELSYNGCTFSPLFESKVSGNAVGDDARRTVKLMEYTISADGYVTMPDGADSIDGAMVLLSTLLTAQGGHLIYRGRGMDLSVNPPGAARAGEDYDVAWGPVPKLLEFQPLGGGRSAKVRWEITVRIPKQVKKNNVRKTERHIVVGGIATTMLQFNYETSVGYGEDGYSSLSVSGTLEVPLTRAPDQRARTLALTADDLRGQIDARIMDGIDLARFHMIRRECKLSRDKRTLTWDYHAEEKPYMDLPPNCTVARGTYGVRPAKSGMGLCTWLCTLRATYTVRADQPRRAAWGAFLALLRLRMGASSSANVPVLPAGNQAPGRGNVVKAVAAGNLGLIGLTATAINIVRRQNNDIKADTAGSRRAWLIDFSFDEGLYLDSKTTSFSATWRLVTTFSHIMLASGLWKRVEGKDRSVWKTSMKDVQGSQSWRTNRADPALDVIVDFGGG